jgi:hypothetical protein
MTNYVALLRAVNVGGTGKLPMAELRAMCQSLGFANVRTYIASGNVVFSSKLSETAVKKKLERALETYAGKPVGVVIRTAAELAAVLDANPFKSAAANRTVAIFLDAPPYKRPADRRNRARSARDLCALRQRYRELKTEDRSGQDRNRTQHEHGDNPRRVGGSIVEARRRTQIESGLAISERLCCAQSRRGRDVLARGRPATRTAQTENQ